MSNIRMLRNILKNFVKNPNEKQTIKNVYKDAKDNLLGMHEMRSTFDPNYYNYNEDSINNFIRETDYLGNPITPQENSLIENFADNYYYKDVGKELPIRPSYSKLSAELSNIENYLENYPLYQVNRKNINRNKYFESMDDEFHKFTPDDDYGLKQLMARRLYKELYNEDADELIDTLKEGRRFLDANNIIEPEDYKYDLDKAMELFGIR
jgi:hypothetical protein